MAGMCRVHVYAMTHGWSEGTLQGILSFQVVPGFKLRLSGLVAFTPPVSLGFISVTDHAGRKGFIWLKHPNGIHHLGKVGWEPGAGAEAEATDGAAP